MDRVETLKHKGNRMNINNTNNTPTVTQITPALLSIPEAAKYLGVHRDTLKKLVLNGELKVVYITKSNAKVPIRELERFVNETTTYKMRNDNCSK